MGKRNRKRRQPSVPGMPRERQTMDGPAKPGPGMVLVKEGERESTHFRNVGHPLDLALERRQITPELWNVGNTYRVMFEKIGRSGLDSTQALDASGGGGGGAPFTQTQVDAIRSVQKIEAKLGGRDRRIIRYYCGEGMDAVEAVQRVTSVHPSSVRYRIVEALESLEDAFDSARIRVVA